LAHPSTTADSRKLDTRKDDGLTFETGGVGGYVDETSLVVEDDAGQVDRGDCG